MSIPSQINRIAQNVEDSLTAVATKGVVVPSGSNSDDLPGLISQIATGSGSAISIVDTTDEHGGIIRTITGVSLAGDTVTAAHLESGYTAHDALGNPITGTLVPGGSITFPTFTIVRSGSTTTITCNMTFEECFDYVNSMDNQYSQIGFAVFPDSEFLPMMVVDIMSDYIVYKYAEAYEDTGFAGFNVTFNDNGTITMEEFYEEAQESATLTVSGRRVTSPAGYFLNSTYVDVASGTAGTPTATKGTVSNHSVSITPSVTNTEGYISGGTKTGTAVTVNASELVSGNRAITAAGSNIDVANYSTASVAAGSATAPSTISGTSATLSTGTNTLTLTKSVSVTPTVSAGYVASGTAGNASVSLTASVTTKAAATYYPSTSDQTVSASQYLTGAQTIKGVVVSGLSADKILSGTTVKIGDSSDDDRITSVGGSVVIQHYYTGSGTPSASTGVNGDIYLKTS